MSPPLPPRLLATPTPAYALEVLSTLRAAGFTAYLVGGCVRDLLRGTRPKDYDIATSAPPEEVLRRFGHTVATGIQHGTVTVVGSGGHVEVTTYRGEEGYQDGRRPDRVFFHDSIEADLARRDFTINAMAFDPTGPSFVDPFGGLADLAARRIRCVGDPNARFGEDGLRPLRAVRFAGVLRFEIDPQTLAAIPPALGTYARVAIERIGDELKKLLRGPRPSRGLRLLGSTGLAGRILPALATEPEAEREVRITRVDFTPPDFGLRLAALFRGQLEALELLKLPNEIRQRVAHLERIALPPPSPSDADLRRFASAATPEGARDALRLFRADGLARRDAEGLRRWQALRSGLGAVLATRPPLGLGDLALDGNQVSEALGLRGRAVGEALRRMLARVLEDPSANTPEKLKDLLRKP